MPNLLDISLLEKFPPPYAVAVSGGADSMALCLMLREITPELTALIVDHGLRPESTAEAQQVAQWLQALNIKTEILPIKNPKAIGSTAIQEKARDLRYELLTNWCNNNKIANLLLAHHADDQLETLLMRLARGSGIAGLAAMQEHSIRNNINLLRPLLGTSKVELVAYLNARGQKWVEDPSNQNPAYTRVRFRKIANEISKEGLTPQRLEKVTQQLGSAEDFIEQELAKWLNINVEFEGNQAKTSLSIWQNTHPELCWRAIRAITSRIAQQTPRAEKITSLTSALQGKELQKPRTLGGCIWTPKKDDKLLISKELELIKI